MKIARALAVVVLCTFAPACRTDAPANEGPQALSLLGEPLDTPELTPERRAELEELLAEAQAQLAEHPDSEEAVIWVGRRWAYLGEYRKAVEVYTHGLEAHPRSSELLRHRGHRFITLRELDRAVDDLVLAAERSRGQPDEVEPDGAPNASGVPRSTKHGNVFYHLALAHYLRGESAAALEAWQRCRALATNDDMRVAADYWLYLTLRRLGRAEEASRVLAEVGPVMDVTENTDYHRLLLFYKGAIDEADLLGPLEPGGVSHATNWYGYGAWHLFEGRPERARAIFQQIVRDEFWPAFGHIAAEAELARIRAHG